MTTNDTRTQLEEERREKVARAISAQGWSCEMHEPDYDCSQCQPLLLATADAAIEASGLPLRNAQVEAVWSKLESLDSLAQIEPDDDDYSKGINIAASIIRRAIEEAGA